jgi:hypothetical protein
MGTVLVVIIGDREGCFTTFVYAKKSGGHFLNFVLVLYENKSWPLAFLFVQTFLGSLWKEESPKLAGKA